MGPFIPKVGAEVARVANSHHQSQKEFADIENHILDYLPPAETRTSRALIYVGGLATFAVVAVGGLIYGPKLLFDDVVGRGTKLIESILNGAPKQEGLVDINNSLSKITFPKDPPIIDGEGSTGAQFIITPHVSEIRIPLYGTEISTGLSTKLSVNLNRDAITLGAVGIPTDTDPHAKDPNNWQIVATVSQHVVVKDDSPNGPSRLENSLSYDAEITGVETLDISSGFGKRFTSVITGSNGSSAAAKLINYSKNAWGNGCAPTVQPLIGKAIGNQVANNLENDKGLLASIHEPTAESKIDKMLKKGILVRFVDTSGNKISPTDITLPLKFLPSRDDLAKQLGISRNELRIDHSTDCNTTSAAQQQFATLLSEAQNAPNSVPLTAVEAK